MNEIQGIGIMLAMVVMTFASSKLAVWMFLKKLARQRPENEELGRPLGRPMTHRHFYAEVSKYVGGYFLELDGVWERVGQISSIDVCSKGGWEEDVLEVKCAWCVDRTFGSGQWTPHSFENGSYYNSLEHESVLKLNLAAIHYSGGEVIIIVNSSCRNYRLIKPNDRKDGNIDWNALIAAHPEIKFPKAEA